MKSYISHFIFGILFLILLTDFSYAGVVVLVKGNLNELSGNKPIGSKIRFIDSDNKESMVNSNSLEGEYQSVLQSGKTYRVVVDGWIVDEENRVLNIPEYDQYAELVYNFKLKKIEAGLKLYSNSFFEKNSAELSDKSSVALDLVSDMIRSQKGIVFEFIISSEDSYFKSIKKTETYKDSKGKNKSRKVTVTTEEQLLNLLEKRKEVILEKLKERNISSKSVNFKLDLIVKKPLPNVKVKAKGKLAKLDDLFTNNLVIKIDRLMKF